ncbi:MAG TPA: hypothetical protein VGR20_18095, partial [Acidimicrobiia bacterium]|nr:hypothetical protein [Acidimicrobiia bacterium]
VAVSTDSDIAAVTEVLRTVGREALADPGLKALLLDAPSVMGRGDHRRRLHEAADGGQDPPWAPVRSGPRAPQQVAMALHRRGVTVEATAVEHAEAQRA